MINIMYHYVRPISDEYPFLNSLNLESFKRQLDFFQSEYGFLSKEEYLYSVKNNKNIDGAVLTFDDGLKDHYQYVLPELKKRKLWGLFFIPTGVYSNRQLLGVHRVHFLQGKYGADKILEELSRLIDEHMIDHFEFEKFRNIIYSSHSYKDNEKTLKGLLNYYIKYEFRETLLDKLMLKFFNEDKLFDDVYLSQDDIVNLQSDGNIIGSHTVSHKVLSRLSYSEQFQEIKQSFDFLEGIIRQGHRSFCYPYGYPGSYNQDTLDILKKLNVNDACIFDNKVQSDNFNSLELSRVDCNRF